MVLVDGAAEAFGVELPGAGQILDPEHDGGHLQWHGGFLSWSVARIHSV
jgi:hypothetical protein